VMVGLYGGRGGGERSRKMNRVQIINRHVWN
jgi:hypothetical protein